MVLSFIFPPPLVGSGSGCGVNKPLLLAKTIYKKYGS
jgi:hypothetical protein